MNGASAPHGGQFQQQEFLEAQQLGEAAREQQEMLWAIEQQHELLRFNNGGFEMGSSVGCGFNHISTPIAPAEVALPMGPIEQHPHNAHPHHHPMNEARQRENHPNSCAHPSHHPIIEAQQGERHPHHHPIEAQLLLSPQHVQVHTSNPPPATVRE